MPASTVLHRLVLACLLGGAACSSHEDAQPTDAGHDGNVGDGGQQPDGSMLDRRSYPRLRASLGVDLATVESFAFLEGSPMGSGFGTSRPKANDGGVDDASVGDGGVPDDQGLYALTLTGDTISVDLVEESNPYATSALQAPYVARIFPTASWVLFQTPGYVVHRVGTDGGVEGVDCNTIAARRADGALYCGAFAGMPTTHGLDHSLQTNGAGDVVYLGSGDPTTGNERVFRLSLEAAGGPTAVGITPGVAIAWWYFSNADGDLLHLYSPSPLDPNTTELAIFPIDGSPHISLGSRPAGQATRGALGDPDQNTFYALVGGGGGIGFMGSIRVFTKDATGFVETEVTPNLTNVQSYGGLLRLASGIHLFSPSEKAIVRIVESGVWVTNPTPTPIVGVDSFLNVDGLMVTPVGEVALFLANTPTGLQFIRHDGITQQDIPIPSDLTLTKVIYAESGAIDFIAVRDTTLETVRGSVAPNATTVELATTGVLDPDRIVTFTRIR